LDEQDAKVLLDANIKSKRRWTAIVEST
jgi:hypothetical protein